MGASNVALVFAYWGALPGAPFRLLTFMALTALDADDPPRFWGGRDALAQALGRSVPPEPDDDDDSDEAAAVRRQRKRAHEAVRIGLKELVATGAVTVAKEARAGRRAEYRLHLTPAHPGSGALAHPGSAVRDNPGAGPGSPRTEALTHPGPEEEGGGPRTPRGQDHLGRSLYLAANQ